MGKFLEDIIKSTHKDFTCNISITKGKLLEDMIDCLHVISVYLWVQRYLVTYGHLILLI